MVKYKLFNKMLSQHGKLFVPNNETSLFREWGAEGATGDVLCNMFSNISLYLHGSTCVGVSF